MKGNRQISAGQTIDYTGYGFYEDSEATDIVVTTTPQKFIIDSLGSQTFEDELPVDAENSLWDSVNNKIVPISLNDAGGVRFTFEIISKTGSPTLISYDLDIGGGASITNSILSDTVDLDKTPPFSKKIDFDIFSRATFIANGGQIFISTDTGTVTIRKRAILITRDHKGRTTQL